MDADRVALSLRKFQQALARAVGAQASSAGADVGLEIVRVVHAGADRLALVANGMPEGQRALHVTRLNLTVQGCIAAHVLAAKISYQVCSSVRADLGVAVRIAQPAVAWEIRVDDGAYVTSVASVASKATAARPRKKVALAGVRLNSYELHAAECLASEDAMDHSAIGVAMLRRLRLFGLATRDSDGRHRCTGGWRELAQSLRMLPKHDPRAGSATDSRQAGQEAQLGQVAQLRSP